MIEETASLPVCDIKNNLYKDLGLDSLSFIQLLLDIENRYSIIFDIMEMESCLEVGFMIALTEKKQRRRNEMISYLLLNQTCLQKTAVIDGKNSITSQDLIQKAMTIEVRLPQSHWENAASYLPDGSNYIAAIFGMFWSGKTALPFNNHLNQPRKIQIVDTIRKTVSGKNERKRGTQP